jgi:nitric oxide synthase oxygenase domain/subunit
LHKYAKTPKRIMRLANQAKLYSFCTAPQFMYGVQILRNDAEAMELDAKNGNNKWRDAQLVELAQIDEYETVSDRGKGIIRARTTSESMYISCMQRNQTG